MKIRTLIIFVILLIAGISVQAADEFAVKLNDSVQLFSNRENEEYITATSEELQEYLDAGIVEYYEPVVYAKMLGSVNWQLENTKAAFVEKTGAQGDRVKVAVIDSGIVKYPNIADRVLDGWDYHLDSSDTTDETGHGTFVSSMIALQGSAFATESYIVPLKVFYKLNTGEYTARSSDIANAIKGAVDTYGCSVINLSLSFSSSPSVVKTAINYAIEKGAIVVAAAGNDGTNAYHYPAAYANVTAVGSTDSSNVVAWFSQRNDSVNVVAPGQNVVVTSDVGLDKVDSGTSFSAPQVSALAAVAKCIKPDVTNAEFMQLVTQTATDLGVNGYDTSYGHGLINCEAFVKKMIEDRKVYISPVKIKNGKVGAVIYNNMPDNLTAKGFYVCGENTVAVKDITIGSGDATAFDYDYTADKVRFMVWDSFKNLVPLCPASEN